MPYRGGGMVVVVVVVVAFFLGCEDLRRLFNYLFPACGSFFFFLNKFHFFDQDQSIMAQRAETTVAECSLTSCA